MLYDSKGYVNVPWLMKSYPATFVFIYGPRGAGKTFGLLKWLYEQGEEFFFMRRTQSELDLINMEEFQPFKSVNDFIGSSVEVRKISKYNGGFYEDGRLIGYTGALSTMAHLRGFDSSHTKYIFYDEFIPEAHIVKIKAEDEALQNAYETINRNRELKDPPETPVRMICCANSNRMDNPIFAGLGLIRIAERMRRKGQNISYIPSRSILMVDTFNSPISDKKKSTALYKMADPESDFYRMAICNRFSDFDEANIVQVNLKNYKPICKIGEICIYKMNGSNIDYYMTFHRRGSPQEYGTDENEIKRFKMQQIGINSAMILGNVMFEDYTVRSRFRQYMKGN